MPPLFTIGRVPARRREITAGMENAGAARGAKPGRKETTETRNSLSTGSLALRGFHENQISLPGSRMVGRSISKLPAVSQPNFPRAARHDRIYERQNFVSYPFRNFHCFCLRCWGIGRRFCD